MASLRASLRTAIETNRLAEVRRVLNRFRVFDQGSETPVDPPSLKLEDCNALLHFLRRQRTVYPEEKLQIRSIYQDLSKKMEKNGIKPNGSTLAAEIMINARLGEPAKIDALMEQMKIGGFGTFSQIRFYKIAALANGGQVDAAEALFDELVTEFQPLGLMMQLAIPSERIVEAYARSENQEALERFWKKSIELGIVPSNGIINIMMKFYAQQQNFKALNEFAEKYQHSSGEVAVLSALLSAGERIEPDMIASEYEKVKEKIQKLPYSIYHRLMAYYIAKNDAAAVVKVYFDMVKSKVPPEDRSVFLVGLPFCNPANLEIFKSVMSAAGAALSEKLFTTLFMGILQVATSIRRLSNETDVTEEAGTVEDETRSEISIRDLLKKVDWKDCHRCAVDLFAEYRHTIAVDRRVGHNARIYETYARIMSLYGDTAEARMLFLSTRVLGMNAQRSFYLSILYCFKGDPMMQKQVFDYMVSAGIPPNTDVYERLLKSSMASVTLKPGDVIPEKSLEILKMYANDPNVSVDDLDRRKHRTLTFCLFSVTRQYSVEGMAAAIEKIKQNDRLIIVPFNTPGDRLEALKEDVLVQA
jgi:hypothetical protein